MEIKVKKATGSPEKTTSQIDFLSGLKVPESIKAKVKADVGDFLVESIVSSLSRAESPVAGESFPALSKEYKAKKKADGLPPKPNLEFEGDLQDALTYKNTPNGIEIGFFGDQAWKADGHLKFSGKENATPKRRFLPDEGQEFKPGIQREIEKIVADAIASEVEIDSSDFESVATRSDLYEALGEYFPDLSRAAAKGMVLRNPAFVAFLDDNGLLGLL